MNHHTNSSLEILKVWCKIQHISPSFIMLTTLSVLLRIGCRSSAEPKVDLQLWSWGCLPVVACAKFLPAPSLRTARNTQSSSICGFFAQVLQYYYSSVIFVVSVSHVALCNSRFINQSFRFQRLAFNYCIKIEVLAENGPRETLLVSAIRNGQFLNMQQVSAMQRWGF